MMPTLREIADTLGTISAANTRKQYRASLFVKLALVTGGIAAGTAAHSIELAYCNDAFSAWTVAGLAAAIFVAIGGAFIFISETDISQSIEQARLAIEQARSFQNQINDFNDQQEWLEKEITRGLELYNSMDVMRGCIEQSLGLPDKFPADIIQTFLSGAYNSLLVALDFKTEHTWTICIYAAQKARESGNTVLRCVAQKRKIDCDIAQARSWFEGVGVAGVAYSTGIEKIIPDMSSPDLGTMFRLGEENSRSYDDERYRSIAAVPIIVGTRKIKWGVVVATSDQSHHFTPEPTDGVSTSEPIRAIAAMAALAVKSAGGTEPASASATPKE